MPAKRFCPKPAVLFFLTIIAFFSKGYSASYRIQKGDTLWSIAKSPEVYGDPWLWPLLWEENLGWIQNPERIFPGRALKVLEKISKERAARARRFASRYRPGMRLEAGLGSDRVSSGKPQAVTKEKPPFAAPQKPEAPSPVKREQPVKPEKPVEPAKPQQSAKPGTKVSALLVVLGWLIGALLVFAAFLGARFLKRHAGAPSLEERVRSSKKVEEILFAEKTSGAFPEKEEAQSETKPREPAPESEPAFPKEPQRPETTVPMEKQDAGKSASLETPPLASKPLFPETPFPPPETSHPVESSSTAIPPPLPPLKTAEPPPSNVASSSPPVAPAAPPVSFRPQPAPFEVKPFILPDFKAPKEQPAPNESAESPSEEKPKEPS